MPRTKKKRASASEAPPIQPELPKPTAKELRKAETKRQFDVLNHLARTFWEGIGLHKFQTLSTFKLILDRDGGCTTPVEHFVVSLIHLYQDRDDHGEGLTLEDIQWAMKENLTNDEALSQAIEDAHWLANRYPLPESSAEPALKNS